METRRPTVKIRETEHCLGIALVGPYGVGGRSLMLRFTNGTFDPAQAARTGSNAYREIVEDDGETLQFFIRNSFAIEGGLDGFVLLVDASNPQASLESLYENYEKIKKMYSGMTSIMLAITKDDQLLPEDHLEKLMSAIAQFEHRVRVTDRYPSYHGHVITSAKTGKKVDDLFLRLAGHILTWRKGQAPYNDEEEIVIEIERADEVLAKQYILNIKDHIIKTEFPLGWFDTNCKTIKYHDGNQVKEKKVPDTVKLHWDEIETADFGNQLYYVALHSISEMSRTALEQISLFRDDVTKDYYLQTSNPEQYFSDAAYSNSSRSTRTMSLSTAQTSLFSTTTTTTTTTTTVPAQQVVQQQVEEETPEEFICGISLTIMTEPTIVRQSGFTYEKEWIEKCIGSNDTGSEPQTRDIFTIQDLTPNRALKSLIEKWKKAHPEPEKKDELAAASRQQRL